MPPQLSLNDLYSIQHKKQKIKTTSFDNILLMVHKRIKNVSHYGGLNTFYEIPGIVFGLPLYDINECTKYIINALRKNGFLVQIVPNNQWVIYISWDPTELKPLKKLESTNTKKLSYSKKDDINTNMVKRLF